LCESATPLLSVGRVLIIEPMGRDAYVPAANTERTNGVYECSLPLSDAPLGPFFNLYRSAYDGT